MICLKASYKQLTLGRFDCNHMWPRSDILKSWLYGTYLLAGLHLNHRWATWVHFTILKTELYSACPLVQLSWSRIKRVVELFTQKSILRSTVGSWFRGLHRNYKCKSTRVSVMARARKFYCGITRVYTLCSVTSVPRVKTNIMLCQEVILLDLRFSHDYEEYTLVGKL